MDKKELIKSIKELKQQKNAVIMAHYYQAPEIQDIADFLGDSLALARQTTSADIILTAGVRFMAETTKILNPNKKVLIPDISAGCSLADSCEATNFKAFINQYPHHVKVSYVNCSAEVKALSDILCTSSNAEKIINSIPLDQPIIFGPDRNLGSHLIKQTKRELVLWQGCCQVHDVVTPDVILNLKQQLPNALILAHPECRPNILDLADFCGSTASMLNFTKQHSGPFIVITENGILHKMKQTCPEKQFLSPELTCYEMKKCSLEGIYTTLLQEAPEIKLPEDIRQAALLPLERMLAVK